MTELPHRSGGLSAFALAGIALAVALLYWLALVGGVSPLSPYRKGAPVGLEAGLTDGDLAEAVRLDAAFARMDYRLDAVAGGGAVPPVFLPSVPADLSRLPQVDTKKRVFLRVLLPLVLVVNQEVMAERRRLEVILGRKAKTQYVPPEDDQWVAELAARYGVENASAATLLRRVDMVPPSLALAQGAEESGWGTSRLVRQANNLFGHMGGVGGTESSFQSLHEAVRTYVHNLNTHGAYENLRRVRAAARKRGGLADGHTLAGSLTAYSERGQAYVDAVRALIRANRLLRFDHARLGGRRAGFAS